MDGWTAIEGAPYPLGASWIKEKKACNFALYSKHATGVTLLLYSQNEPFRPMHQL
jgi:isoamylase